MTSDTRPSTLARLETLEAIAIALTVHDAARDLERESGLPGMFEQPERGFLAALEGIDPAFTVVPLGLQLDALGQAIEATGLFGAADPFFLEIVGEIADRYSRLLEERPKVAPESESEKREAFGK